MMSLDTSELEAVRYPIMLYNSAVDRAAYCEFGNVFTENALVIICGDIRLEGRDAIIAGQAAGARRRGAYEATNFQRHNMGNSMINIVGPNQAKSVHYINVTTELGFDHTGTYVDELVRESGRWWISKRLTNMEWARPDSRFLTYPGKTLITPWRDLDIGLYQEA